MNTNESKYNRVTLCFKRNKRPIRFLNNFIQFSMQYITTIRTSRTQMFFEIDVIKVCNIHRKTPALESLFSKVASMKACNFIKKRLQHMFFCEYRELFKKISIKVHQRWLLLYLQFTENLIIQIGKLMTHIFNKILCLYYVFLHFYRYQFC